MALCEDWKCSKKDGQCPGIQGYKDPETGEHLPLNHERFNVWALDMVCSTVFLIFAYSNAPYADERRRICHHSETTKPQAL
jgi:hypothetical protein